MVKIFFLLCFFIPSLIPSFSSALELSSLSQSLPTPVKKTATLVPSLAPSHCLRVKLSGSFKTKKSVLLRTLDRISRYNKNSCHTTEDVDEFIDLLERSQLYYSVEKSTKKDFLQIDIKEKWTLIPILKASSSAGSTQFVLGAYDPDFLGSLNEVGLQYENLSGSSSYVTWFRTPSTPLPRWKFGVDAWSIMKNQILYNDDRDQLGGFSISRKRVHLFADYFLKKYGLFTLHLQHENDTLSEKSLSSDIKKENNARGFSPNEHQEINSLSLEYTLDRLKKKADLVEGWMIRGLISGQWTLGNKIYSKSSLEAQAYLKTPFSKHTYFAIRSLSEHQSLKFLSQRFYLGSFDRLRGFLDAQIPARAFSLLNLELRSPWVRSPSFVLQNVLFSDQALLELNGQTATPLSVGTGFRFIFPKIYRLNIRADYAFALSKSKGSSLSLGLQHFF